MSVGKHDPREQAQRENDLRLTANERGLLLVKFSAIDDPLRPYSLVDQQTKTAAVGNASQFLLSLDEVAAFLTSDRIRM